MKANRKTATGSHIDIEAVAITNGLLLDDLTHLVVAIMGVVAVAIDFGRILGVGIDKIKIEINPAPLFVGDATDIPVGAVAIFTGDYEKPTNF